MLFSVFLGIQMEDNFPPIRPNNLNISRCIIFVFDQFAFIQNIHG